MANAAMAQLVEHILGKDEVPGPNTGSSSRQPRSKRFGALVFYKPLLTKAGTLFVFRGCLELLLLLRIVLRSVGTESGPHTKRSASSWLVSNECRYLRIANTRVCSRLLAAARSHFGSDSPPDCHSLPKCRYATRSICFGALVFHRGNSFIGVNI